MTRYRVDQPGWLARSARPSSLAPPAATPAASRTLARVLTPTSNPLSRISTPSNAGLLRNLSSSRSLTSSARSPGLTSSMASYADSLRSISLPYLSRTRSISSDTDLAPTVSPSDNEHSGCPTTRKHGVLKGSAQRLRQDLSGCLEAEDLPRVVVEFSGDAVQVSLAEAAQIGGPG